MTSIERLRRFVEKWPPSGSHEDPIYGLWIDKEDAARELFASDIRGLLDRIAELERALRRAALDLDLARLAAMSHAPSCETCDKTLAQIGEPTPPARSPSKVETGVEK